MVRATAVACVVLVAMSATKQTVVVEANLTDAIATSLRGGRRALVPSDTANKGKGNYYDNPIITSASTNTRRLEDGGAEEEDNGEEEEEEEEEQEQQQENNYGEQEEEEEQQEEEEQEEENAQNGDEAMDDDGNGNGGQSDTVSNIKESFQSFMDRFDEDVINMWSTSPSEWDDEFWKVFGIVAGVFSVLLSCIFYICCLCCSGSSDDENGKAMIVGTQSEADMRSKNKRHRGRFFARSRSGDTETEGGDETEHTGRNTTNDWESPFVLIEDVEKDDTFTQGSKLAAHLTSPVYAQGSDGGDGGENYDTLSPLSSNSKTEHGIGMAESTAAIPSPVSRSAATTIPTISQDYDDDAKGKALKKNSSVLQEPSGGIVGETMDVWSEFLGFKKSKYNMQPDDVVSGDEDEDIDLTDDERTRRTSRSGRVASSSSKRKSSSRKSVSRVKSGGDTTTSQKLTQNPGQMRISAYTSPVEVNSTAGSTDPITAEGTSSVATDNKLTAETPVMSNSMHSKPTKTGTSPRKTALLKTKNLLRSFGSNGTKNKNKNKAPENINTKPDPKEESLLGNNETATEM